MSTLDARPTKVRRASLLRQHGWPFAASCRNISARAFCRQFPQAMKEESESVSDSFLRNVVSVPQLRAVSSASQRLCEKKCDLVRVSKLQLSRRDAETRRTSQDAGRQPSMLWQDLNFHRFNRDPALPQLCTITLRAILSQHKLLAPDCARTVTT